MASDSSRIRYRPVELGKGKVSHRDVELQATSEAMRVLTANARFFDKLGNLLRSGTAFGRSALVVAASGNQSNRFWDDPFVLGRAYHAATEDFLSAAALEQTGDDAHPFRVASFSYAGAKIAGPGVDIISASLGGGLRSSSGTSMATPHVGVAMTNAVTPVDTEGVDKRGPLARPPKQS